MPRQRIGLVGLGMAVKPHALSLIDLKDEVELAETYGLPVVDSADAMFDDPTIGAIMLLTPPNTHLAFVRRAAAAGKHILLEKPLETSFSRSQELVETAEKAGVRLAMVLQWRFRRTIEVLTRVIAEGRFGEIASVSMRLNNWRPQSYYDEPGRGTKARDGGGVLLTQAIHTIDQMIALAGLPIEVSGYAVTSNVHRMETEDLVHAAMRFENGAIGGLSATTAAYPGFADSIDILGTNGSARIDGQGASLAFVDGTQESVSDGTAGDGAGANPMAFSHHNHRAVLADFLGAVRDGRDPKVSGREALKAHRLIEAVLKAAESGKREAV
jgi:UDP-N-acetyl-2-amino-2-deoxyglucuronate dehydrogenase